MIVAKEEKGLILGRYAIASGRECYRLEPRMQVEVHLWFTSWANGCFKESMFSETIGKDVDR